MNETGSLASLLDQYAGPHLTKGLGNVAGLAELIGEFFGPQADFMGAREYAGEGNIPMAAASLAGVMFPGNVRGMDKAVRRGWNVIEGGGKGRGYDEAISATRKSRAAKGARGKVKDINVKTPHDLEPGMTAPNGKRFDGPSETIGLPGIRVRWLNTGGGANRWEVRDVSKASEKLPDGEVLGIIGTNIFSSSQPYSFQSTIRAGNPVAFGNFKSLEGILNAFRSGHVYGKIK